MHLRSFDKTFFYILTFLITGLLVFLLAVNAYAATAKVTGKVVNIRSAANTNSEVIGSLYKDTVVNVLEEQAGWSKVTYANVTGWVSQSYLEAAGSSAANSGLVTGKVVNVRSAPNTSSEVVGSLDKDTRVNVLEEGDGWAKVSHGQLTGWVSLSYVELTASLKPTPTPNVAPPASNEGAPLVYLDGRKLDFEVNPIIENDRTLVPLRAIFEAMGAEVSWNDATRTVIANRGNDSVVLTIGSNRPIVNGNEVLIDVAAKIVEDRIMAPLRFVGEAYGGTVNWDAASRTITMTSPKADNKVDKANTVIVGNTVNLRSGPDVSYKDIDQALPGERLAILGEQNGWYQVSRGGTPAWVAGWVVDVAWIEGESPLIPDPLPEVKPVESSVPDRDVIAKDELRLSYTNDADGIILKMSSGSRLNPVVDKGANGLTYTFADLTLEGLNLVKQNVGNNEVKMRGINSDGGAIVSVEIPRGVEYRTESIDGGKAELIIFPNYIMSLERKSFGKTGERLIIPTMSKVDYTKREEGNKVVIELLNISLGEARTSYTYSNSIINEITLNEVTGKTPKVILTIDTNDLGQSSAGIGSDGALNIMLRGKSEVRQVRENLILLDAGHGGKDTGARGATINEKDVTLDITLQVGNILKQKGYEVDYIRTDDTYIAPEDRPIMANRINPEIFVSIHINSAIVNTAMGIETYYYAPESNPDLFLQREERERLARSVQTNLIAALKRPDRGVKPGNYGVLRNSNMPSILTEVMFINNATEEELLKQPYIRTQAAEAIAKGIDEYMRGR